MHHYKFITSITWLSLKFPNVSYISWHFMTLRFSPANLTVSWSDIIVNAGSPKLNCTHDGEHIGANASSELKQSILYSEENSQWRLYLQAILMCSCKSTIASRDSLLQANCQLGLFYHIMLICWHIILVWKYTLYTVLSQLSTCNFTSSWLVKSS